MLEHIREGRFQRSLSLMVAATSAVSGLEVGYEHYRGGYSNRVMWSPVVLSGLLTAGSVAAFFSRGAARTWMRWTSYATFLDGLIGFGFHVRGIARKPGGWSLPLNNIVMGPPIFAPLLFGTSAYLGILASYLRRERGTVVHERGLRLWQRELSRGHFQNHLCVVTIAWAFFTGFEAWYSHYKTNFKYPAQWLPVGASPLLMVAAALAIPSRNAARFLLPAASLTAITIGAIGFYYHARGILYRPAGKKKPLYNILYGPPIFAPLLLAACGTLGMLAAMLRKEDRR